jgi:hypothetical protein
MEVVVILECLREKDTRKEMGLATAKDMASRLVSGPSGGGFSLQSALNCVNGKSVDREIQQKVAEAAVHILAENQKAIMAYYKEHSEDTKTFLANILSKYRQSDAIKGQAPKGTIGSVEIAQSRTEYIDVIFENWKATFQKGAEFLKPGIYQLFRLYKSTNPVERNRPDGSDNQSDATRQPVICEVIYVDSHKMECIMVTSEKNIYFGTMFINHENILYGLLQRRTVRKRGINQRFIALKLSPRKLPMYSGLSIKTGDTTRRPVASDCLYVEVPQLDHAELYAAFDTIRHRDWTGELVEPISERSIICQYLTDNPPGLHDKSDAGWRRVKLVSDFPALSELVVPNKSGAVYVRESLRTISSRELRELPAESVLSVFRHGQ